MIAGKSRIIKCLEGHAKEFGLYSRNDLDHGKVFNRAMTSSHLLLRKVTLLIMWKIE